MPDKISLIPPPVDFVPCINLSVVSLICLYAASRLFSRFSTLAIASSDFFNCSGVGPPIPSGTIPAKALIAFIYCSHPQVSPRMPLIVVPIVWFREIIISVNALNSPFVPAISPDSPPNAVFKFSMATVIPSTNPLTSSFNRSRFLEIHVAIFLKRSVNTGRSPEPMRILT
ncbi:MAG: hypothetical protein ACREOP_01480, partial [Thermodesulfobacteriota bacterium]